MTTNVTTPVLYALGTVTTLFSFTIILLALGIMGKQRSFQEVAAEAGTACLVADDETPAANAVQPAVLAGIIDRAGAEGADDAVGIAERTLQGDQRIGDDAAFGKGQGLFDSPAVIADIGAGDTDDGCDGGKGFSGKPGIT